MFFRRYELQFKLFSKLEPLQGPSYTDQLLQNGMQVHATSSVLCKSLLKSFYQYLDISQGNHCKSISEDGASFYSAFSLGVFKTGTEHASKSLQ